MFVLLYSIFFYRLVSSQQCQNPAGIGACVGQLCPSGSTCINPTTNPICCPNNLLITATATQTCATPTGVGPCLGQICPIGSTCINIGTANQLCCLNTEIGVPSGTDTCATPGGIGLCVGQLCPTGYTCINPTSATPTCCLTSEVNVAVAQTCATSGGIGNCVGTLCPTGYTCLNAGTANQFCCLNSEIGVTTTTTTTTTSTTTVATTTSKPCYDLINPNTRITDCVLRRYLCNSIAYYSVMSVQCPRTCGRCVSAGSTTSERVNCVDSVNPITGVSECPQLTQYCNIPSFYALMTIQCGATCRRCSSTTLLAGAAYTAASCQDQVSVSTGVSECPSLFRLCNNAVYYDTMTRQCPRTCERCLF